MQRSKGFRTVTRSKLKKPLRGKMKVTEYLRKFNVGDKVIVKPLPSSHKGMPHPRYIGGVGTVISIKGKSYLIKIKDQNKEKKIYARPEHLMEA